MIAEEADEEPDSVRRQAQQALDSIVVAPTTGIGGPSEPLPDDLHGVVDGYEELSRTMREFRTVYAMADDGLMDMNNIEPLLHDGTPHNRGEVLHRPFVNSLHHPPQQAQNRNARVDIEADLLQEPSRDRSGGTGTSNNNNDRGSEGEIGDDNNGTRQAQEVGDDSNIVESSSSSASNDNDSQNSNEDSTSSSSESALGWREEEEAYRKLAFDKEVFHLLHKILSNDPTATSLSLLPEAERVLATCDWDTSTLLTHKHSRRAFSKRALLNHVSRQMESQQPHLGTPTGADLLQQALAQPPLFLRKLQLFSPLISNRLDANGQDVLANFLATSACLREFTIFHISPAHSRAGANNPEQHVLRRLISAISKSSSIQKVALRKLYFPSFTECDRLLGDTRSLIELVIAYCSLEPIACDSLKSGFSQNSTLRKVVIQKDLNDCAPSLVSFFEGLKGHKNLNELEVEMMACQQSELNSLGQCVAFTPNVSSLSLIVSRSSNSPSSQSRTNNQSSQTASPKPELTASAFYQSLSRSKSLRKLRMHPYATLKDEGNAWRVLLDDGRVELLDLGQGLSRQTNAGLVAGVRESMLHQNQTITDLNLSNANCHGELSLCRLLSSTPCRNRLLRRLCLRNCGLLDSDCEDIADGLENSDMNNLSELDLGSNCIGFHGLACWGRSLAQNSWALESLDLSFNSFGHNSCVKSFALLLESKKLKSLDVSCTDMFADHPSISDEDVSIVADTLRLALAHNRALIRLAADDNGFSDALCTAFFVGLGENSCLKELSLDGNSLRLASPGCQQSITEMLSKNKVLDTLSLPRNRGMTETGFRALASGIKRNRNLKHLAVRVLCVEALPKLQTALVASQTLVKLTVAMPSASDRAQAESRILSLLKCLGKVQTFQQLCINNGEQHLISPSTGRVLLRILRTNPSFESFNLSLALCTFELRVLIEFFLELNKRGRRFLDASLQQPVGLWPHILAPLARPGSGCAKYLFFFLREHVALHH